MLTVNGSVGKEQTFLSMLNTYVVKNLACSASLRAKIVLGAIPTVSENFQTFSILFCGFVSFSSFLVVSVS